MYACKYPNERDARSTHEPLVCGKILTAGDTVCGRESAVIHLRARILYDRCPQRIGAFFAGPFDCTLTV